MIRIEIEIDEQRPGKVDVFCRSVEGCWCESTAAERAAANKISAVMRRDIEYVSKTFGTVKAFEGEVADRLRREGQV